MMMMMLMSGGGRAGPRLGHLASVTTMVMIDVMLGESITAPGGLLPAQSAPHHAFGLALWCAMLAHFIRAAAGREARLADASSGGAYC
jgi:hypothetical protein